MILSEPSTKMRVEMEVRYMAREVEGRIVGDQVANWTEQTDLDILLIGGTVYRMLEIYDDKQAAPLRKRLKEILERRGMRFTGDHIG